MATWAIGDVQGCFETLQRLLERLSYDPDRDRLWLVGDLVNRGPRSLDVLRWARSQGTRLTAVLGNHDLHLLGHAYGIRSAKRRDTLDAVVDAPDRDELLDWLRQRPLFHREDRFALVHAGLLPAWTLEDAQRLAGEIESDLRSDAPGEALRELSKGKLRRWDPDMDAASRRRLAYQAFTRLRTCDAKGVPDDDFSGAPDDARSGFRPWFEWPSSRDPDVTIVCGHWAALGLHIGEGIMALDTGCVWGRTLTAVRLEDREVVDEPLAD